MGWLTGWQYRRQININNSTGSDLTDYQIKVELNSTNFDFSKAQSNGEDIRFTSDDGKTFIPYWIESWDSECQTATIWVKVPSISTTGATIYMYYGNASVSDNSDGDSTFIFFDDFEGDNIDTSKWMNLVNYTIEDSTIKITGGNEIVGPKTINSFTRPFVIEFYAYVPSGDYDSGFKFDNGYYALIEYGQVRYTSSKWMSSSSSTGTGWFRYRLQYIDGGLFENISTSYSYNVSSTVGSTTIQLYCDSDSTTRPFTLDWIAIRKYADPEPTIEILSEEKKKNRLYIYKKV